jgi:[pyruvate, water dikinase]-phosphate phosphotransferase / [pyruvate, water dikinase] kinase
MPKIGQAPIFPTPLMLDTSLGETDSSMKTLVNKSNGKPLKRVPKDPIQLYVLSDSTGNLARHMVTSFLTQFPAGSFQAVITPFVNDPRRLFIAMGAISDRPGIVFHAVVSTELKEQIAQQCEKLEVPCWDLTGSAVEFLARTAKLEIESSPRRLHPLDGAYCGRINALSFALEHDDGLGLDSLAEADVVLTGVSRTGKTPTSMFLAMQGYRVANVALAIGVAPPKELFAIDHRKVIGLVIEPTQLVEIRARRRSAWRMNQTNYDEPREVAKEIQWSRQVFADLHCAVLNVTDQAIEETAARIVDMLGLPEPSNQMPAEELI